MRIVIETIPHAEQRYPTVGDYWQDPDGTLQVRVSDMQSDAFEFLVILHELVESMLCFSRGTTVAEIDRFDLHYAGEGEPGDDMNAPYWQEHQFASGIERLMAAELSVNWLEYDRTVNAL